jgi:tetratricopeptide (TPR) repeat protein
LLVASQALLQRGDLGSAKFFLEKATVIAETEDDPDLIGRCYLSRGILADSQGHTDDSIRFFGVASESFAKVRQFDGLLETATRKAIAEERQGRVTAAIETLTFLQMESMAGGNEKAVAEASAQKCRLHTILKQLPEAKEAFGIASGLSKEHDKPSDLARLDMLEAGILDMEGNAERAVETYNKAFKFYSGNRGNVAAANCRFNAALILSGQGHHEKSNALLIDAAFYYAQSGSPTGAANAIGAQGANYLAMKNLPVAKVLLEQAAVMHELGGNMMRAAENQILLGILYRQLGNENTSEIHLSKAVDLFKRCGLEEEGLKRSRMTRESIPLGKQK